MFKTLQLVLKFSNQTFPLPCNQSMENGAELSPYSSDTDSSEGHNVAPGKQPTSLDIGKRVLFYSQHDRIEKYGVLRFIGTPEFADGTWCGVELDHPAGKNNGSIHGIRYFNCEPKHGVFVPVIKVEKDSVTKKMRSRPNSASRGSSVERNVKTNGKNEAGSSKSPIIQQELVNRLTQPPHVTERLAKRKAAASPVTSWRQPLKAFAQKGVSHEHHAAKEAKKLMPFRAGGMYKAQSTENLRSSAKNSEQNQPTLNKLTKKSSSERDLRNSKLADKTNHSVSAASKTSKRKPARVNSCSDLTAADTDIKKPSSTSQTNNFPRPSGAATADTDAISDSNSSPTTWYPRTSTPGNREDSTPDGCSSPEDETNSQAVSVTSTPVVGDQGFVATPDLSTANGLSSGTLDGSNAPPTGLATHTSQFVDSKRSSVSVEHCRVPSPDSAAKTRYHNRPSGSATLTHPLTSKVANSAEEGEEEETPLPASGPELNNKFFESVSMCALVCIS